MRHDFYAVIHKALRRELALLVAEAGTARTPSDWRAIAGRLRSVELVLDEHAGHEARFLHPRLCEVDAKLVERIDRDHVLLEGSFDAALRAVDGAASSGDADDRRRAYRELASFVVRYSQHMLVEELEAMPAFWSAATDAELLEIHASLVASIPPDTMGSFLSLMLPAIDLDEQLELLGGVRATAPAPVFAGVMELARQILSPPKYDALDAALGGAS